MKNVLLPSLAVVTALFSTNLFAQKNRAFAVTSETIGSYNWNTVREINLETGEVTKTFYDRDLHKNFEVVTTANAKVDVADLRFRSQLPMESGVAATAFDQRHNRLYFTTMRGTELRYFDLNSSKGKIVYHQEKPLNTGNRFDEANVITRMAFAADGFGYALTNDGKHLVRFSTDQKASITDLGQLIDGKKNGSISVHNQCSSWGGDMVGDAYGNLYLVSMRNHVFKINPKTNIADHIGVIKGLPETFTTNGIAVDAAGEMFLSSATFTETYFKVNISSLQANPIKKTGTTKIYNSSDLANGNLLYQNKTIKNTVFAEEVLGNRAVSVYPNPVSNKTFKVQFEKVPAGRYHLQLTDALGKTVLVRSLNIGTTGQVETIQLAKAAAAGVYMIKLTGTRSEVVYNNKIVVK